MRVVHDPEGDARDLATDVDVATGVVEQGLGLIGRSSIPENYALVFEFHPPAWPLSRWFDAVGRRMIHMLGVRFPIDVLWIAGEAVRRVETLDPWTGFAMGKADTVIELPAGGADGVAVGDRVVVDGLDEE